MSRSIQRKRLLRTAFGLLTIAVVGAGIWSYPAIHVRLMSRPVYLRMDESEGVFISESRAPRGRHPGIYPGPLRCWYPKTGYLQISGMRSWEGATRLTEWTEDGRLKGQYFETEDHRFEIHEPPWLWGAEPQTAPSAPWLIEGKSLEQWWDSLPRNQKARLN